jgi:hypothetical protein
VICTSIFREDSIGVDSTKVEPAYSRFLETIYEENEEETDGGGDLSVDPGWLVEKTKLVGSMKALI